MGNYFSVEAVVKEWTELEKVDREKIDKKVRKKAREHSCWNIQIPRKGIYEFNFYMMERKEAEEFCRSLEEFNEFSEIVFLTPRDRTKRSKLKA